jgi:PAS domain S-box-containing protein
MQLIHPDDAERILKQKDEYFAGNTPFYSSAFRIRCANGTYKWVMSKGMIVASTPEGGPIRFLGTHTDITAHKEAEEKYYSAAQMLSKLINNLRDGILVADENRKIIYANQMFCDLYNLSEPPSALLGMDIYESIALRKPAYKDPEKFYRRTIQVLETMEMLLGEEWEMNDGKIVGRDHIPLVMSTGNKGSIWKFRDITIQKNNEKQLADLRNFYEQILNHIDADIVVFDTDQRYLFINPSAVKNSELRGWMIGKTDEDYRLLRNKPLEFSRRRTEIFEEAKATRKNIQWEEMLITRAGEPEFHLRNHYPVFDAQGNHLMSIGYGLNITDRVLAQQELKTSRDTFASAFRDSGIGMALLSHEGMYIDANNALCDILEYSKYDLQQRSLQDLTHPDDVSIDAPFMVRMMQREISTYNTEKRFISQTGKIVLVSLTMSLVWSNDGLPKFFILQAIDITRRKGVFPAKYSSFCLSIRSASSG